MTPRRLALLAMLAWGGIALADQPLVLDTTTGQHKAVNNLTVPGTLTESAAEIATPHTITTATATLSSTDHVVYANRAGTVNLTLPATPSSGRHLIVCDASGAASTNTITLTANTAQTVAGAATKTLTTNYKCIGLRYDTGPTDWHVEFEASSGGSGTVTSVGTSGGVGGGPIGTTGTVYLTSGASDNLAYELKTAAASADTGLNLTTANKLRVVASGGVTMEGVYCYWPTTGTTPTLKGTLRNGSGTTLKSCTMTAVASDVASCTFGSTQALNVGDKAYVGCWDETGTGYVHSSAITPATGYLGPGIVVEGGYYFSGDTDSNTPTSYQTAGAWPMYHLTP